MKLAYGKAPHNERQPLVANNDGSERDEAPQDSARLAMILIAELSACLQMITDDIVCATDLDEARTYWSRRLMALAELIERTSGNRDGGYRKSQYGEQDAADSSRDTQSIVEQRVKRRSLRLTAREREIMELTTKGYRPKKIARRLYLSVQTVYTHLRNARYKQRMLDFTESS